jgi:hypothetical protein
MVERVRLEDQARVRRRPARETFDDPFDELGGGTERRMHEELAVTGPLQNADEDWIGCIEEGLQLGASLSPGQTLIDVPHDVAARLL